MLLYAIFKCIELSEGIPMDVPKNMFKYLNLRLIHLVNIIDVLMQNRLLMRYFNKCTNNPATIQGSIDDLLPFHLQPIVFDKFKYITLQDLYNRGDIGNAYLNILNSLMNDECGFSDHVRYVCDFDHSMLTFIYNNFEDTIGIHNLWYSYVVPKLSQVLNLKVYLYTMTWLNYTVTGKMNYSDLLYQDNLIHLSLAYIKTLMVDKYTNLDQMDMNKKGKVTFVYTILESCRQITDEYYDYYKDNYGAYFINLDKEVTDCLKFTKLTPVDIKDRGELAFHDDIYSNAETYSQTSFYLGVYIWLSTYDDSVYSEEDLVEVCTNHPLKLVSTQWHSNKIATLIDEVCLKTFIYFYEGYRDVLINNYSSVLIEIGELYPAQENIDIYLDAEEKGLFMKIMLLYLLSIPLECRKYSNLPEIKRKLMIMGLGL